MEKIDSEMLALPGLITQEERSVQWNWNMGNSELTKGNSYSTCN